MQHLDALQDAWTLMHDPLTGLPTSGLFYDRVHQALLLGRREGLQVVLMLASLDLVAGPAAELDLEQRRELMREVAARIGTSMRSSDSAGRLDGGLFGVLLPHSRDEGVPLVAGRIMVSMLRPFHVGERPVLVRTSVGVAVAGGGEAAPITPEDIFAQANTAMAHARSKGGGFEAFDTDAARDLLERALASGE